MSKLGYVILYVADVSATLDFYEAATDLRRGMLTPDGAYGELHGGENTTTKLSFASLEQAKSSTGIDPVAASPCMEVALEAKDVQAAYAKALRAGAASVMEPCRKPWGQDVAYVRDINGFLLELCSPMQS